MVAVKVLVRYPGPLYRPRFGTMTHAQPKRVVSLIASATEIICALGARDLLVGRSHECDFPPDVTRSPSLTQPKFPVARIQSGTAHRRTRSRPSAAFKSHRH